MIRKIHLTLWIGCSAYWLVVALRFALGMYIDGCSALVCKLSDSIFDYLFAFEFLIPALGLVPSLTLVLILVRRHTGSWPRVERWLCIITWLLVAFCILSVPAF